MAEMNCRFRAEGLPRSRAILILLAMLAGTDARTALSADEPLDGNWAAGVLAGPETSVDEVVFAVRSVFPEHWYANFGYFSPDDGRQCYGREGRLCKLQLRTGRLTVLVDDPQGAVREAGRCRLEGIKRFDMPGF